MSLYILALKFGSTQPRDTAVFQSALGLNSQKTRPSLAYARTWRTTVSFSSAIVRLLAGRP
ncbi:hypothetical protein M378DRAFT_834045 [Amanita muscaria Koide BX008]|uniref:Uncharacterized protein n=1 Tax=Amanita muscaria (strain Koide BX008) TaxID=946122 RepID=A0A0C2XIP9_AMAMK|nr:hypothetical protein M378DRAFT_834045 [Amanita muscaria Koide BX008]